MDNIIEGPLHGWLQAEHFIAPYTGKTLKSTPLPRWRAQTLSAPSKIGSLATYTVKTMPATTFRAVSRRIGTEKSLKYIGTASVKLDHLNFPNAERPNQKNVDRLVKLFQRLRGCSPGEKLNRIPAVIGETYLQDALAMSNLSREALLSSDGDVAQLHFPSGFRLECLRGKDRVQAARQTMCSAEPRWVVDLFAAGPFIQPPAA